MRYIFLLLLIACSTKEPKVCAVPMDRETLAAFQLFSELNQAGILDKINYLRAGKFIYKNDTLFIKH